MEIPSIPLNCPLSQIGHFYNFYIAILQLLTAICVSAFSPFQHFAGK